LQGSFAGVVTLVARSSFGASAGGSSTPETRGDRGAVKIAVVQQNGNPGRVDANRKKALGFAAQALAQRADVILFHEELLVGYVPNLKDLAEPAYGTTTQSFQRLLHGTDSLIIYGLTEKQNDKYFISAVVVSQDGIVADYHKTHLYPEKGTLRDEPSVYSPGDRLVTFDVKGHKSGVMICFDGDFPEMTRAYAHMDCTMLFWMNNRLSRGHDEVKSLAFSNSMIMATSCCCGKDESGNGCPGGSNITGPYGERLAEIWNSEGIITAEVFPDQVSRIRKENVFFTSQRPELYR
jgi:predicted amidohydrolase